MISAFGVERGEISKGAGQGFVDRVLLGSKNYPFSSAKQAYHTGRGARAAKIANKSSKALGFGTDITDSQIKAVSRENGLIGRIGYHQEKIVGGTGAAATGGGAYALGRKKKKGSR